MGLIWLLQINDRKNIFSQKVVIMGGFILITSEAFFYLVKLVSFKCCHAVQNSHTFIAKLFKTPPAGI